MGFPAENISHAALRADDFDMATEDHGRAPAWHAYVGKKT